MTAFTVIIWKWFSHTDIFI